MQNKNTTPSAYDYSNHFHRKNTIYRPFVISLYCILIFWRVSAPGVRQVGDNLAPTADEKSEEGNHSDRTNQTDQTDQTSLELPLVDFGVVAGGEGRFDVCRLFLASLQLVSTAIVALYYSGIVW